MSRQKVDPPREHALKALRRTETSLSFPKLLIGQSESTSLLQKRQKAFTYELVMGTLRHRGCLDWALEKLCETPLDRFTPWIRTILRMGMYQILYLDAVPKTAAVDESVKLAKKYGHSGTAGLVNAVLRNAQREELLAELDALGEESTATCAIKHSHPEWLIDLLTEHYGRQAAVEIMKNNNTIPPLTARVNTLRITREALLQKLGKDGIGTRALAQVDDAIQLEGVSSPSRLEAHKAGLLYFQDPSSMLAVQCLGVNSGDRVLDVCAGPGGKTTHIAATMKNEGVIYALDLHKHRVELIEDNARRLGAEIVEARQCDATGELAGSYGGMDRVLVDAPCSGVGVMRRRVDLKWRLKPEQVEELARLQSAILEKAAACVRSRGVLVYSTCTVTRKENAGVVSGFLDRHSDFSPDTEFPLSLEKYVTKEGFVQILPGNENMDGFFIARLRRL
jgi:16S rRNA (cytosine967-C5)-methyltransferase